MRTRNKDFKMSTSEARGSTLAFAAFTASALALACTASLSDTGGAPGGASTGPGAGASSTSGGTPGSNSGGAPGTATGGTNTTPGATGGTSTTPPGGTGGSTAPPTT